jgi:hypothetical protein
VTIQQIAKAGRTTIKQRDRRQRSECSPPIVGMRVRTFSRNFANPPATAAQSFALTWYGNLSQPSVKENRHGFIPAFFKLRWRTSEHFDGLSLSQG